MIKLFETEYEMGRRSGYPPCCILAYKIRTYFLLSKWFGPWMLKRHRAQGFSKYWQHIPCWLHMFLRAIGLYRVKYHTCKECGWVQLNDPNCRVFDGHHSYMPKFIHRYYLRQIKEHGMIISRFKGRIGKEIQYRLERNYK